MIGNYETIRLSLHGSIAWVALNRPQIRNAVNEVMIRELRAVFRSLYQTPQLRGVVLTGEGSAFCAGADLPSMQHVLNYSYEESFAEAMSLAHLLREMYEFPRPLVCRVNGAANGAGTGLVAVCDIAIAVETAVFCCSEIKIGLLPTCIAPYMLRRIGERCTREFFLSGERMRAAKALQCGLLNQMVPAEDLDRTVGRYVENLLSSGPHAVATCKRMLRELAQLSLDDAGPYTAELIARLRQSPEGHEGITSFLQRRRPAWCTEADEISWTDGLVEEADTEP